MGRNLLNGRKSIYANSLTCVRVRGTGSHLELIMAYSENLYNVGTEYEWF